MVRAELARRIRFRYGVSVPNTDALEPSGDEPLGNPLAIKAAMEHVLGRTVKTPVLDIQVGHRQPSSRLEHLDQPVENQRHISKMMQGHRTHDQVKPRFLERLPFQIPVTDRDVAKARAGKLVRERF